MSIASNQIKLVILFCILCTMFNISYVKSTNCPESINEEFSKCENCETVEGQILYVMEHIVPNINNREAFDYMEYIYNAIQIRESGENKTMIASQFCMKFYFDEKTDSSDSNEETDEEDAEKKTDEKNAGNKTDEKTTTDIIELSKKFNEQDELEYNEYLKRRRKYVLNFDRECMSSEKETDEKGAEKDTDEKGAEKETIEKDAEKTIHIMKADEDSDSSIVVKESDFLKCMTFFRKVKLLHNKAEKSVESVYFTQALFMWPCEAEDDTHLCEADFMKKYIKHLVDTIDIDKNRLRKIDNPKKFCTYRECYHAVEESLLCIGNCHTFENYLSNAINFVDYRQLQDENSKMYMKMLYDNLLITGSVLSSNRFCMTFWRYPVVLDCINYLRKYNLHRNTVEKNVEEIFFNHTINNVQNYDPNKKTRLKYFNPVTYQWQKKTCEKYGIKLNTINLFYSPYKRLKTPETEKLKKIKSDGNCYFRALSVWITGDQSSHILFRQKLIEFMRKSSEMLNYFGGEQNLIKYLEESKMADDATWATEVEVHATAIMLDTTILVYAHSQTNKWEIHHRTGDFRTDLDIDEKCIYLQTTRAQHFEVIIAVKEHPDEINYFEKYIMHIAKAVKLNPKTKNNGMRPQLPTKFCTKKTLSPESFIIGENKTNI